MGRGASENVKENKEREEKGGEGGCRKKKENAAGRGAFEAVGIGKRELRRRHPWPQAAEKETDPSHPKGRVKVREGVRSDIREAL